MRKSLYASGSQLRNKFSRKAINRKINGPARKFLFNSTARSSRNWCLRHVLIKFNTLSSSLIKFSSFYVSRNLHEKNVSHSRPSPPFFSLNCLLLAYCRKLSNQGSERTRDNNALHAREAVLRALLSHEIWPEEILRCGVTKRPLKRIRCFKTVIRFYICII